MVTTLSDVMSAKQVLTEVCKELRTERIEQPARVALGAMIEIPAAALAVREILKEVDFISVGTNDLLQYFMAADRDNERVIHYNDPTAPPFLWLLQSIIQQAKAIGRETDVAVCGEIASVPQMVSHLLKLGYRTFSIAPVAAELVRKACSTTSTQSAQIGLGATTRLLALGELGV
jgi:phosphotransferase system enzyme I (PtsI)